MNLMQYVNKKTHIFTCILFAVLLLQSSKLASDEFKKVKIIYLYYNPKIPDEVEYTFFSHDELTNVQCHEKLKEVLKEQQRKLNSLIKNVSFRKNWSNYGGEPYLVVNRHDDLRQFYLCKGVK